MTSVTFNTVIKSGKWVLRKNVLFAPFFSITLDEHDADDLYDLLAAREELKKTDRISEGKNE